MSAWFPGSDVHLTYKGRTALRYLCDLMGLRGSEVLVPSYNCGAETEPLIEGGARIVPYVVDRGALVDMDDLRELISKKTKAIHVTHYFGFPQPIEEIKNVCDQNNLFLIEDCALALFSGWKGKMLGSWGDVAIFSLPKTLPLPDGGALVVNNEQLASSGWQKKKVPAATIAKGFLSLAKSATFRSLSEHRASRPIYHSLHERRVAKELATFSSTRDPEARLAVPDWMHYSGEFDDRALSRLSERLFQKVDKDAIVRKRRSNYLRLLSLLPEGRGFKPLYEDLPPEVCPLGLPLLCNNRDALYTALLKRGVESAAWWPGFDRNMDWTRFSGARFLKNHVLLLPVHQNLGDGDMGYIAQSILSIADKGG